jgi:hypothetical protein
MLMELPKIASTIPWMLIQVGITQVRQDLQVDLFGYPLSSEWLEMLIPLFIHRSFLYLSHFICGSIVPLKMESPLKWSCHRLEF